MFKINKLFILSCCFAAAFSLHSGQGPLLLGQVLPSPKSTEITSYPKRGSVDLDLPPKQRWSVIINLHRDNVISTLMRWQSTLDQQIPSEIQKKWVKTLEDQTPNEYLQELAGIQETLNDPRVTWDSLLLYQLLHEFGLQPQGDSNEILVAAQDGTVLHGRSLDHHIDSTVIEITFLRDGNSFIVASMELGSIAMLTALKPGYYSFAISHRDVGHDDTMYNKFVRAQKGYSTMMVLSRTLLEENLFFDDVIAKFRDTNLIKAAYIGVGGAGPMQGAVIARFATSGFRYMKELLTVGSSDNWFVVQTNDDLFSTPNDVRRNAGIMAIEGINRVNMTPQAIVSVIRSPPLYSVKNNASIFVMCPKSGQYCSVAEGTAPASSSFNLCPMWGWHKPSPEALQVWRS